MGDKYDYPPEDSDRTWHIHDDDGWGWDVRCAECEVVGVGVSGDRMNVAITHLQRQNREGTTTASEEREMLGDRWNDPKIGRVT